MFIVVAIVIFGIFIGLSYTLFGSEGLSNDLETIFTNATEKSTNQLANKRLTNILKNEDTRDILTNNIATNPIQIEKLKENAESFQRLRMDSGAQYPELNVHSPMFSEDIDIESLLGKDITLSLAYRFESPNHTIKIACRFYNDGYITYPENIITKDSNGWNKISINVKDLKDKELNKDSSFGFVTLVIFTDDMQSEYVDIKDINLSIVK